MSASNMVWAWKAQGLKPSEKLILVYLTDCAFHDGHIEKLNVPRIQTFSGMTEPQVSRSIAVLEKKGFLRRLDSGGADLSIR